MVAEAAGFQIFFEWWWLQAKIARGRELLRYTGDEGRAL